MDDRFTLSIGYEQLDSSLFTSTSFAATIPTTTEPDEDTSLSGVFNLKDTAKGYPATLAGLVPDLLHVIPYGTDANNEDYLMRVWGWSRTHTPSEIWIPTLLCEVTVTLGNIDGSAIASSVFMADTIVLDSGNSAVTTVNSHGSDRTASMVIDPLGAEKVEFDFDLNSGASPSAGAGVLIGPLA